MSLSVHVRTCDFRLIQDQIRPLMDFVILYLHVVESVHSIDFEILVKHVVEPVHLILTFQINLFGMSPST